MAKKQKLELTWIGKDDEVKLEPRVLIEDSKLSYGDKDTENMIIHGDNLLALKALEQKYAGKVKCIYIDPPYNTGNAFEHYDDGVEHSIWLSLMKQRLELLHNLLAKDGVIFISIDDEEMAYLKVLLDEIFGRNNFIGNLIWEKKKKPSFLSNFGGITENILTYSKHKPTSPNFYYGTTTEGKKYPINNAGNGLKVITFPAGYVKFNMKDTMVKAQDMSEGKIITKLLDNVEIKNKVNVNSFSLEGEWRYSQQKIDEIISNNEEIRISKVPFRPNHIKSGGEPKKMKNLLSIAHFNMSTYEDATAESIALFGKGSFDYPKPEKLISTLINAVTEDNDLILDSFLGSGTTASVSHKMNRRYIGIELGNHAKTLVHSRLKKVVNGDDQGGISKEFNWQGGGGFKFYTLAPSLLKKDKFDNWIIEPTFNAELLASSLAKQEAFTYYPDSELFWKQGYSTENDFIFTTTQFVTAGLLDKIHDEMKEDEALLICAKSFQETCKNRYTNISIKKIPQVLLGKCEFGKDDYSLNILEDISEDDDE